MIVVKNSIKGTRENGLDEEWIDLVLAAKKSGLTSVEVRAYISGHSDFRNEKVYLQFIQKQMEEDVQKVTK